MPTLNHKADYMRLSSIYTFDVKMMMLKFLHGFNSLDLHLDKSLFIALDPAPAVKSMYCPASQQPSSSSRPKSHLYNLKFYIAFSIYTFNWQ